MKTSTEKPTIDQYALRKVNDLLSTARNILTVRKSLTFVSVESKLFRAAKAIFTLPSAREGINLACGWIFLANILLESRYRSVWDGLREAKIGKSYTWMQVLLTN